MTKGGAYASPIYASATSKEPDPHINKARLDAGFLLNDLFGVLAAFNTGADQEGA